MSGKGKRRGGPAGSDAAPVAKRVSRKGRGWTDPAASWRRQNMRSYMTRLWAKYPRNMSAADLEARRAAGPYTISGHGDYRMRKGASIGSRIGAWLGDRAQSFLGRVTGLGDYSVKMNSLMTDPPQVRNNSARTVTLSHREYLCDIVSGPAGSFSVQNFVINPGNTVTFPWLSGVASKFQQYRLDGMIFQFKSMSADALNSTNTALGQVIMATNYDVNQPLFDSKYEMENTEFSTSVKPSLSAMHPIECARTESTLNELYVAAGGNIPPGGTASMYNFGNFQIATNGFQAANVNIGELWVTYEVTLFKPIQTSINETGNLWAVDLFRPQFSTTDAVVTGPFCIPNSDIVNYQKYVPQIRAGTVPTLDITVRPTGSYNQFELRPKGANIFPEGTLFMFVTTATINAVPPDPAWTGTASWNVDVTAAESNLQQVVGVFNFPAQTRFGTTNNGLQDAAAVTIARVKYAPAYVGKPLVFTVNGSAPRSTGPTFTFGGYSIKVFQIPEDMYDELI